MKKLVFLFFFLSFSYVKAQKDSIKLGKKHSMYISWGYTKAWYGKSTIRFKDLSNKYHPVTDKNNYYDFTIHDVTARDRPDYDKIYDVINITIPQFVVHVGFQINSKWDIEANYDHTKYVVDYDQRVRITGQISGNQLNKDTTLSEEFLRFEHTDGANFAMLNAVRKFNLIKRGDKFSTQWVLKGGGGFVYPRTDVKIFGERLNNRWHIAGWIVGLESGLRINFLKHGFFEFVGKGCYADYVKCLVLGKGNGTARHHFWVTQLTATLGYNFNTGKKAK